MTSRVPTLAECLHAAENMPLRTQRTRAGTPTGRSFQFQVRRNGRLSTGRINPARAGALVIAGDCDEAGLVREVVMKPVSTNLTHGWCCAVWTPAFTEFLHSFLRADETRRNLDRLASKVNDPGGDLAVGVVLQAAAVLH